MKKQRNPFIWVVAETDPARYKTRTVRPERGKGRKTRPRKKTFDSNSYAV